MVKKTRSKDIPVTGVDQESLLWVLDNLFGNVLVTDAYGNILFVNQNTVEMFQTPREELMQMNSRDLVSRGMMSYSVTLEALAKRKQVIGYYTVPDGRRFVSVSTPKMDENGDVVIGVNYAQEESFTEGFVAVLDQLKKDAENYRSALRYMAAQAGNVSIVAESPQMKNILFFAQRIARSDSTVLLLGESGAGKDVLANYIWQLSARKDEPFIPVNCAAIPKELMESEFFGYVKGAFTGANVGGKAGFFEMANKGVLFLDEIAELPMSLQTKLLRVLETSEFTRVGATTPTKVNIRLIAATNVDLEKAVRNKTFRKDLYYRINVIPITIPPLRERRDDIEPLAQLFLNKLNKKFNVKKVFSPELVEQFLFYSWPGNVRELKNAVERVHLLSTGEVIPLRVFNSVGPRIDMGQAAPAEPSAAPRSVKAGRREHGDVSPAARTPAAGLEPPAGTLKEQYKQAERQRILDALLRNNGNKSKTAKELGMSVGKLYRLLSSGESV